MVFVGLMLFGIEGLVGVEEFARVAMFVEKLKCYDKTIGIKLQIIMIMMTRNGTSSGLSMRNLKFVA